MKMKVLEYFICLAESRSINEAAKKLYVAQPSLTKALQAFEQEIGTQLFYRGKFGITLTEAGAQILPEARQVLAYYNGWIESSNPRPLRALDVCAQTSLSGFLLPGVILRFKETYPELAVNYIVSMQPEKYVSAHGTTMALCICNREENYLQTLNTDGIGHFTLFNGQYGCLLNKKSPLAKKQGITLHDLEHHFFIAPSFEVEEAQAAHLTPVVREVLNTVPVSRLIQVGGVANVIDLLKTNTEGFVISCSPAHHRYDGVESGELVFRPFLGIVTGVDICLLYSKSAYKKYPEMQELAKAILEAARLFTVAYCLGNRRGQSS